MDTAHLRSKLAEIFPDADPANAFATRAPGRVNLIGEHTDYNGGFVCPMAIDRSTLIVAAPRPQPLVRMHSLLNNARIEFSVAGEVEKSGPAWSLYAKGSVEAIRRKLLERNPASPAPRGFDCVVHSTVPLGGGLSSSASFEVATALAMLAANAAALDKVQLALACQWAEHHYPGVPCGIMDQFASALGQRGHALLLDCRNQAIRYVPLERPDQGNRGVHIVISNSNVKHELTGGEYKARRQQCEAAVAELQKKHPAVQLLRDATPEMLEQSRGSMDPVVYRRARHVVTEIARAVQFAAALEAGDYAECGRLMLASHQSLRDDYEVSTPELDALVDIAKHIPGVEGARMTGGGFGGCIVALCHAPAVEPLTRAIETQYPPRRGGSHATTFAATASDGAHLEPLP